MLEGSTLLDAAKNYYYYFFNDGIITTHFLYKKKQNQYLISIIKSGPGLAWPVASYNQLENGELHVTYFFAFVQRQAKTKSRVGVI